MKIMTLYSRSLKALIPLLVLCNLFLCPQGNASAQTKEAEVLKANRNDLNDLRQTMTGALLILGNDLNLNRFIFFSPYALNEHMQPNARLAGLLIGSLRSIHYDLSEGISASGTMYLGKRVDGIEDKVHKLEEQNKIANNKI